jgi:general stress protein 26
MHLSADGSGRSLRSVESWHNRRVTPDELAHLDHLYVMLKDFHVAMVVGHGDDGELVARPMAIARIDRGGPMYFTTQLASAGAEDLAADPRVTVIVQSKTQFAAVRGLATLSSDRALVDELWQESWRSWYPAGKDDPQIAILVVEPHHGEYWDNAQASGLKFVFAAAKAYLRGRLPEDREEHAEVDMTAPWARDD